MVWPFLYFAGERLTTSELMAARLDGDLVELGEAYLPADAVETRELRAGSLRALVSPVLAATHESAAWIHGMLPEPPLTHSVQRAVARRINPVIDVRVRYRDLRVPPADLMTVSGVAVTTPVRTLADLVREAAERGTLEMFAVTTGPWRPEVVDGAIAWFDRAATVHHKREAQRFLIACRVQEEVTRYTS